MAKRIERETGDDAFDPPSANGGERWSEESDSDSPQTVYRRRRVPVRVRRNRWRDALEFGRRWRWAALTLAAVLLLGLGVRAVLRSAWFVLADSGQIEIGGARQVSRAEVVSVFGGDLGRNVFFIPLEQRRAAIENIDWVRSATVMRLWPARLRVRIDEREPVAFARTGRGLRLIDADGVILQRPVSGNYSFPVLTGLASDPANGNAAAAVARRQPQMAEYLRLRDDLDRNGAARIQDFSEIDLRDPTDVQATVVTGNGARPTLIHFGDHNFYDRYQLFLSHIQEWRQTYPDMAWVELQFDGQAIVDTGATAPAAAAPPAAPVTAHNAARPKLKSAGRGHTR